MNNFNNDSVNGRVQFKCDGTRWRTGGEVKGKLANGVGRQYPSLHQNLVYPALLLPKRTLRLPVVDWTDAPTDLNGLVRFAERRNLVSARVPSHFRRSLKVTTRMATDSFWSVSQEWAIIVRIKTFVSLLVERLSLNHKNYVRLALWRAALIFTRYSTAFFICLFSIPRLVMTTVEQCRI
jgi:hypothetical protein